jgi:hypothetical protein
VELEATGKLGAWLEYILPKLSLSKEKTGNFEEFEKEFSQAGLGDFKAFWEGELVEELREMGLLVV